MPITPKQHFPSNTIVTPSCLSETVLALQFRTFYWPFYNGVPDFLTSTLTTVDQVWIHHSHFVSLLFNSVSLTPYLSFPPSLPPFFPPFFPPFLSKWGHAELSRPVSDSCILPIILAQSLRMWGYGCTPLPQLLAALSSLLRSWLLSNFLIIHWVTVQGLNTPTTCPGRIRHFLMTCLIVFDPVLLGHWSCPVAAIWCLPRWASHKGCQVLIRPMSLHFNRVSVMFQNPSSIIWPLVCSSSRAQWGLWISRVLFQRFNQLWMKYSEQLGTYTGVYIFHFIVIS